MSDPFNNLERIVKEENLHINEGSEDEFDMKPFAFYREFNYNKPGSIKLGNRFLERVGSIIYCSKTNESGIDWEGKPPELVIMGLTGYIKEKYNKEPNYYILTKKWNLEKYNIIKA